jgi:hypothetical protein
MVAQNLDGENGENPHFPKLLLLQSDCSIVSLIDCFTPRNTILLIQDLDWVLGVQVSLERCHFWQHDVHKCLQTFLQLRHVEDVMNCS